ncbi:MAG: hypothetical protein MR375_08595, partial [Veillonellaceae bacterium]|nr:hypothetical protein [Veillonellaceae bacterium]
MMTIDDLLKSDAYSLSHADKQAMLLDKLAELTKFHRGHCAEYGAILDTLGFGGKAASVEELPFIPVRLFKEYFLHSVPE